jgi:hypothetical protein
VRTLIKGSTITFVVGARHSENGLLYEPETSVEGTSSCSHLIFLENPFLLHALCSQLKSEDARFYSFHFVLISVRVLVCFDLSKWREFGFDILGYHQAERSPPNYQNFFVTIYTWHMAILGIFRKGKGKQTIFFF